MKKLLSVILVTILLVNAFSFATTPDVSSASNWAQSEVTEAYSNGLMPERLTNANLQQNITRAQFASLAVKLYEGLTDESVTPAPEDSFIDTTDIDVLKAKAIEVMNGDAGKASPNDLVTREQMAAMFYRTLSIAYEKYGQSIVDTDGTLEFNDKNSVSDWAIQSVDYVNENGIMTGDAGDFLPLANAPVEQAVAVIKRLYKNNESLIQDDIKPGVVENDYTLGYTIDILDGELYVNYSNTGNNELFATGVLNADYFDYDKSKIFYVHTNGIIYEVEVGNKAPSTIRNIRDVKDFVLIDSGTYKGYAIYKDTSNAYHAIKVNDTWDAEYIGKVSSMIDPEKQIDNLYNPSGIMVFNKDKLSGQLKDAASTNKVNFYGDSGTQAQNVELDKLTLLTNQKVHGVNAGVGPMYLAADAGNSYDLYTMKSTAKYSTKLNFIDTHSESANAGIVFGVKGRPSTGNDMYTGYYVGILPNKRCITIGTSNKEWQEIVELKIPSDLDFMDTELLLEVDVTDGLPCQVTVHLNGQLIGKSGLTGRNVYKPGQAHAMVIGYDYRNAYGAFGVRTYQADVVYSSFKVE